MILAILVYKLYISARSMPTIEKRRKKMSEQQNYFNRVDQEIAEYNTIASYSSEQMEIYERGKKDALRGVLIEMGHEMTYGALIGRVKKMLKFLESEKKLGKLATGKYDVSIWEKHLSYSSYNLMEFVMVQFRDYQSRLRKAREIHKVNMLLLQEATQLTIE